MFEDEKKNENTGSGLSDFIFAEQSSEKYVACCLCMQKAVAFLPVLASEVQMVKFCMLDGSILWHNYVIWGT